MRRVRPAWLLAGLAVLLVASVLGGLSQQAPGEYGGLDRPHTVAYIAWAGLAGAVYAVAVATLRWLPDRVSAVRSIWPIVLGAGLAARLLVLAAPPVLSTDIYRYVWDGRVQAAGINPYRYLPVDPALAALRDEGLGPTRIFRNINRADTAPTIYPPAAQALFAAIGLTLPGIYTVKAAMLGFDLVTTAVLLRLLRAAGRPAAHILVWAWNPLVIWEFAGAGHIDAMALAFVAAALLLATRARAGWASAALAMAVLAKLLPLALYPAMWRPWNRRGPAVLAAVVAAGYAAYSAAGWRVFGYLPGYTQEEQLQDGGGFLLLRLARLTGPLPDWAGLAYVAAGLCGLALAALLVVRRPLPAAPAARARAVAQGTLVLAGALIAVMSPHYPWYLAMLALPAVLVPAWSALWPTIAGPLLYLDFARSEVLWPALVFLPSLALLWLDLSLRPASAPALLAEGGP